MLITEEGKVHVAFASKYLAGVFRFVSFHLIITAGESRSR